MRYFILLTILPSLLLTGGCQYLGVDEETDSEQKPINTTKDTNDDEYLQIAKDLFVAKQYKQAYRMAKKLAQNNNPEAHYLLGYLLYYGYGVKADKEQGKIWIKKAADTGYRPAIEALVMIQYNLTPDKKCPTDNGIMIQPNESGSQ